MPKEKIFFIPSKPVPQARARVMKGGWTFDPNKDKKNWFRLQVRERISSPFKGAVRIDLEFFMPIPRSTPKKRLESLKTSPHIKKPDLDNLVKFSMDGMSEIAFVDDRQVCEIHATKKYGENPGTLISVKEL